MQPSRGLAVAGIVFLVKLLLLIPHFIVLWALGIGFAVLTWVGYWIVAITGVYPPWLHDFVSGYLRWLARVGAWAFGLVDAYPPFTFEAGGYPADVQTVPNANPNRGLAVAGIFWFVKPLLLLPHAIVLGFLYIGAGIAAYVGYWIVAITGQLPEGLQTFFGGVLRWQTRIYAWQAGIVDQYPPFSLS
jgi:hypothetical protein